MSTAEPRAATPAAPAIDPAHGCCANCGAPFVPAQRRFCPECGQETRIQAPTIGEFIQQFGGAYLSTEGALWRTLKLLLLKPGELTRQYLAGRRKHYVLPLRLYLTISVIAFLLLRTLASNTVDVSMKIDDNDLKGNFAVFSLGGDTGAGLKDGKFYCDNLPQWLCKRLQRRLDTDRQGLQREFAQLGERMLGNLGAGMFVMLPVFALWQKLVYINRRLRYTEHLVFALHLHAFWFLALMFTVVDSAAVTAVATLAIPVYGLWAQKRVYGDRWWTLLLRVSVVSTLYLTTLGFVIAGVAIWSLLF
jgi:hypothetical protein